MLTNCGLSRLLATDQENVSFAKAVKAASRNEVSSWTRLDFVIHPYSDPEINRFLSANRKSACSDPEVGFPVLKVLNENLGEPVGFGIRPKMRVEAAQLVCCAPADGDFVALTQPTGAAYKNYWAPRVRYNRGQDERMARIPLTKEVLTPTKLIIKFGKVGLTDEQFSQLCSDNGDLFMELTAQKELIIMPPVGVRTGWRESVLVTRLTNWAEKDGTGMVCGPDTLFKLPNTAIVHGIQAVPANSWLTPRGRDRA